PAVADVDVHLTRTNYTGPTTVTITAAPLPGYVDTNPSNNSATTTLQAVDSSGSFGYLFRPLATPGNGPNQASVLALFKGVPSTASSIDLYLRQPQDSFTQSQPQDCDYIDAGHLRCSGASFVGLSLLYFQATLPGLNGQDQHRLYARVDDDPATEVSTTIER
ncbi:MAG: hypothetical protein ACRDPI_03210, partial [Nocardioidaceae bacterium]